MSIRGLRKTIRNQLSIELKKLREEQNLTIPEIATQTNLSCECIESIEQGRMICFTKYRDLAYFYGKKIKISLE